MPDDSSSHVARGQVFQRRVADAYRALGYQVEVEVQLPGQLVDVVARRELEGGPRVGLAVECKDHGDPIGNQLVQDFIASVAALQANASSSGITGGAMVSASGFTPSAQAAGRDIPDITLLSWADLTAQLFNVAFHMQAFVEEYEQTTIFRDYLTLDAEMVAWGDLARSIGTPTTLDKVMDEWMGVSSAARAGHSLFVLGDFGAGKSTFLRHMNYRAAQAYLAGEDSRVPLFVPLRSFRDSQDVTTLLRASFRARYLRDLSDDLLWQRLESGLFYVLLDGFDEMAERITAERRVELFAELLPILRSPSPATLTSRPSYFVEHGELERLLSTLRQEEAALTEMAFTNRGGSSVLASRIRRRLVSRHRDPGPAVGAHEFVSHHQVGVVRLLPLNQDRIREFVEGRDDHLREVGTSSAAVLAFIDRTYDLTDLATRPLLLTLIVDSVLEGGLNVDDRSVQLGPSGLYEVYTHVKLDLDLAKGLTRQRGLSRDARRLLAESVALAMYRARVLEVDFEEFMATVLTEPGPLQRALEASRLSPDEIATDFATCSFITLSDDGSCRFIHKSFRAFFVARVLKDDLRKHPIMAEWLDQEVLYFLGGFAPTQPAVADQLWARFLHSDKGAVAIRRNALVGYLYTRPGHDTRKIEDAEVADADFGDLTFGGSHMNRVTWRDCTLSSLTLNDVRWKRVAIVQSHLVEMRARGGKLELAAQEAVIEALRVERTTTSLRTTKVAVETLSVTDAVMALTAEDSRIDHLDLVRSALILRGPSQDAPEVGELEAKSTLRERKSGLSASVRGEDSVLVCQGTLEDMLDWELERCIVKLAPDEDESAEARRRSARFGEPGMRIDARSVVLSNGAVTDEMLQVVGCGVFGSLDTANGHAFPAPAPSAWGVLAGGMLWQHRRPSAGAVGFRWGGILIAEDEWYDREVAQDGRLSAVGYIERAVPQLDAASPPARPEELVDLVDAVRNQYSDLARDTWSPLELRG